MEVFDILKTFGNSTNYENSYDINWHGTVGVVPTH